MRDVLLLILGAILTMSWYLLYNTYLDLKDPYHDWDCTVVQEELKNFRECLTVGHACHVDGPEAFGLYHEQVDFFKEMC